MVSAAEAITILEPHQLITKFFDQLFDAFEKEKI